MGTKISRPDAEYAAVVELNSVCSSYALDVSTVSASLASLPIGRYKVWLKSGDPTASCFLKFGGAAAAPTSGGGVVAATFGFSGAEVERIYTSAVATLHAILSTGATATTLYLTKLD